MATSTDCVSAPALNRLSFFGTAAVILYAGALILLAADRVLDNRFLGTKLDRRLDDDIGRFRTSTADTDRLAREELASWHEFSVPHLINGLESLESGTRENCHETLVDITGQNVMLDSAAASEWKKWWDENRNDFWKKRNPPKRADDRKDR